MSVKLRPDACCAAPIEPDALASDDLARLVAGFKALGDSTRLEIFNLVAAQREPICACDVVDRFEVSQPTISHHLKVLREAGLISATRRGVWAFYTATPAGRSLVHAAVAGLGPDRMDQAPVRLAATG